MEACSGQHAHFRNISLRISQKMLDLSNILKESQRVPLGWCAADHEWKKKTDLSSFWKRRFSWTRYVFQFTVNLYFMWYSSTFALYVQRLLWGHLQQFRQGASIRSHRLTQQCFCRADRRHLHLALKSKPVHGIVAFPWSERDSCSSARRSFFLLILSKPTVGFSFLGAISEISASI